MDVFRVYNLQRYLDGISRLFDIVRIVNPITKEVIYKNGFADTIVHRENCYEFWKTGNPCDNCISSQAFKERKNFTKIEYLGDGVYVVIASPIIFGDDLYVLELVKDITETGIATGLSGLSIKETNDIIAELNKKVLRDDLTGLYNRRYINQRLPTDIDYAKKHKERLTVIMLDIDYFKRINDTYGHVAGDLVLKGLSRVLSANIRKDYDWVARYGGDEFIIILKNSDQEIATKVMKEIQDTVENMSIRFDDNEININISIGSSIVNPGEKDFDRIIYEVDENLRKAKDNGKNRS